MNSLIILLRQKYRGLRRDIYGVEYSTIYTSLVDAIYARDKTVYQPIFDSNEYISINWDLIPFVTYLAYTPDNLDGNYPPLHRLSASGRVLMMYLYKGGMDYGFNADLLIEGLKQYENNGLLQVITIPESIGWAIGRRLLLDDPTAVEWIQNLDKQDRFNGYISLYLNHHDKVFNICSQTLSGYGPTYGNLIDQSVQEYLDEMDGLVPDIYTTIPDDYTAYSQYYPLPVYDINIGLIIHLDRPDLLDYKYSTMSHTELYIIINDYIMENNKYADIPLHIGNAISQYLDHHI